MPGYFYGHNHAFRRRAFHLARGFVFIFGSTATKAAATKLCALDGLGRFVDDGRISGFSFAGVRGCDGGLCSAHGVDVAVVDRTGLGCLPAYRESIR